MSGLSQFIRIHFLVEADDQGFAAADGGGAEVAGGADNQASQFFVCRFVFFDIEADDRFPFRRDNHGGGAGKLYGCGCVNRFLFGVDFGGRGQFGFRKKLLRLFASVSAGAVVVPVNFFGGHGGGFL